MLSVPVNNLISLFVLELVVDCKIIIGEESMLRPVILRGHGSLVVLALSLNRSPPKTTTNGTC